MDVAVVVATLGVGAVVGEGTGSTVGEGMGRSVVGASVGTAPGA